ncbi:TetR/AcrR family transcriptional regulator [Fructilactobacillus hinvesii]|uniref:TetR/AcrR family transcriptional regulator n=1 Tax=Fructilactobacillus hinvesii TaxID=2940300 RepID=A0ABY5BT68_9LACO|nr:TetR/AcrR family transcriptional regulator [Fructilactobacillus hinvesii]USS88287.1 TetR/AcrR family transcriptional regulator [Fructilactobacillus hinvesii]
MANNIQNIFNESLQDTNLSDKQKTVLKASLDLFSTKGFDSTSTKDIANSAGVAEGTVYQQFKNKRGILDAILNPFIDSVLPKIVLDFTDAVKGNQFDNVHDFLTYVIKNRMKFALTNQNQVRIFAQEIFKSNKLLNQMKKQLGNLLDGPVAQQLQKFQERGEIAPIPIPRLIQFLFSTTVSFVLPAILNQQGNVTNEQIDGWTEQSVDFILHGITL